MPSRHDKAMLLLEQERYALAEAELRLLLAENPDDGYVRQMLARALEGQGKHAAALHEAREAVRLAPDDSVAYYTLANIHLGAGALAEADAATDRAIELDPRDPDCYALRAAIRLRQEKWPVALAAAEAGLAIDPDHRASVNFRTQALTMLGRRGDAQTALAASLARDPQDEITHCNLGWELLAAGDHERGIVHFREALRLDPNYEYARQGFVEAMKSKHRLYGLLLRALFAVARWPAWVRWTLVIAYLVALRALTVATRDDGPYVRLGVGMLNLLLLMVWLFVMTASPLLLLTLRFTRHGRHVLSPAQRAASNWHAAMFVVIVAALGGWRLVGLPTAVIVAVVAGLLMPPVSHVYECPPGAARRWMALYVAATAVVGLLGAPLIAILVAIPLIRVLPNLALLLLAYHRVFLLVFLVAVYVSGGVAEKLRRRESYADAPPATNM